MMRAPRFITLAASCAMTKVPTTLTSYILRKSSSVTASNLPSQNTAALLTSTSRRGSEAISFATAGRSVIDSA